MPDIDLPLFDIPDPDLGILSAGWSGNISAGILAESVAEFPISAGILEGFSFPLSAGIAEPSLAAPEDALAAHLGQGVLLLTWTHPNPSQVEFYEVWASLGLSGPYSPYQHSRFRKPRGLLYNVPVGITAYFQVRAIGYNQFASDFTQVKQGRLERPYINLQARAIAGSVIPAGEIFTCPDQETGRLIAVRPVLDITF